MLQISHSSHGRDKSHILLPEPNDNKAERLSQLGTYHANTRTQQKPHSYQIGQRCNRLSQLPLSAGLPAPPKFLSNLRRTPQSGSISRQ